MECVITRKAAAAIIALGGAAALPLIVFARAAVGLSDLHVRSPHLLVHSGSLARQRAPGQGFRCAHDGLYRIDVRMLVTEPDQVLAPIVLVLRVGSINGPEVRRVSFDPVRDHERRLGSWASFEFEPLTGSAGTTYWLQLIPGLEAEHGSIGPWIRYRAQEGARCRSVDRGMSEVDLAAELQSSLPALSAVAVAVEHAAPESRFSLDVVDERTEYSVRHATVSPGEVRHGWVFIPFAPLLESYAREYRFELRIDGQAVVRSHMQAFHGRLAADEDLLGMTHGEELFVDRDLFIRTFSAPGALGVARRLGERAGWRLIAAGLAWVVAVGLAGRIVTRSFAHGSSSP